MFSRLFAFIILVLAGYAILVFIAPDFADKYGDTTINAKLRNIKEASLSLWSGWEDPISVWEDISGRTTLIASGSKQFMQDAKQTADFAQSTITEKTEQIKQAANSVEKAYNAVNAAKNDIQKAASLSGITTLSASGKSQQ